VVRWIRGGQAAGEDGVESRSCGGGNAPSRGRTYQPTYRRIAALLIEILFSFLL
jgi:hypothetical protein